MDHHFKERYEDVAAWPLDRVLDANDLIASLAAANARED